MLNFSLIILMWMVLLFAVLISCNYFVGIARELSIVLVVMNQLIFATLPMLAASIISWFLCVEIPSMDLLLSFNAIYFIYTLYLGRPRVTTPELKKSGKVSPTSAPRQLQTTLPPHLLILMYGVPVVITICMHIAVHHNVLATTHTSVTNFLLSVLIPCLLMTFCAYKQLLPQRESYPSGNSAFMDALPKLLDGSTLALSTALIYCLESHPMLDELKSFSELSERAASYCIMAATGLIAAAFALHRFCRQQSQLLAEQSDNLNIDGAVATSRLKLKYMSMVASLCIGGANALVVTVIGLPDHATGVSIVGAMALSEYYLHPDWSLASRVILVLIAALYSSLAANSFIKMTLQGIAYQFHWYIDLSLPDLTTVVNCLVPVAIALPTLVSPGTAVGAAQALGLLPGAHISSSGSGVASAGAVWGNRVFEWAFPLVAGVVSAMELLVREQVGAVFLIHTSVCCIEWQNYVLVATCYAQFPVNCWLGCEYRTITYSTTLLLVPGDRTGVTSASAPRSCTRSTTSSP
jgi:hypothetical protein